MEYNDSKVEPGALDGFSAKLRQEFRLESNIQILFDLFERLYVDCLMYIEKLRNGQI